MSAYAVPTADPTAVMGRRIAAFIVDMLIISFISLGVFSATVDTQTVSFNPCADPIDGVQVCSENDVIAVWNGDEATLFRFGDTTVVNLFVAAYGIAVFWIWQGLSGMTVGKALFGIRTVNEQGQAPGIGKAIVRSLLMIVDGFCCYLVGLISAMSSKGHRRIGDMGAKTFVINKDAMGTPVTVPGLTPPGMGAPGGYPGTAQGWSASPPPATGYGAAPPPGGYGSAPVSSPPAADAAPAAGATAAGAEGGPQWDPARNAYIQWDPTQQQWLQFDDATQQWRPIDQA